MKLAVVDTEIYRDYFLIMFLNIASGKTTSFELYDGHPLDVASVTSAMNGYRTVGFNSRNFDLPIIYLALSGATNETIKEASDAIIVTGLKPWHIEEKYKFKIPNHIDHMDIIEVAPGKASLKSYGARIHTKKLQDLPIDPSESIAPDQRETLKAYCANDLHITYDLFDKLTPQIALRERMGKEYGQDLRSKSDAQVAETVIKSQVFKLTEIMPTRPEIEQGTQYKYKAPEFVNFITSSMNETLKMIESSSFVVGSGGKVNMPPELKDHVITIGNSQYRMGIGGLHSCEKSVSHVADRGEFIIDRDVVSYYPAIILKCRLFPEHMGEEFLTVYQSLVSRRLEAKKAGDKVTADSLKITINGSFGKLGSMWSALYAPRLLIQTTVTGQLSLLMLIELLNMRGIEVISANTDGVVFKTRDKQLADRLIKGWEEMTGFETEETLYKAVYSKDVNNYVAVKTDNGVKLKGQYVPPGFMKNPANEIVSEAIVNFLTHGKHIEDTIRGCFDIRKFITVRAVKGGAVKDDQYLGKTARWYYSKDATGVIQYKLNGYTVAKSNGAKPVMELPEDFPDDINYDWYITEAQSVLADIGWKENENAEDKRQRI